MSTPTAAGHLLEHKQITDKDIIFHGLSTNLPFLSNSGMYLNQLFGTFQPISIWLTWLKKILYSIVFNYHELHVIIFQMFSWLMTADWSKMPPESTSISGISQMAWMKCSRKSLELGKFPKNFKSIPMKWIVIDCIELITIKKAAQITKNAELSNQWNATVLANTCWTFHSAWKKKIESNKPNKKKHLNQLKNTAIPLIIRCCMSKQWNQWKAYWYLHWANEYC